MSKITLKLDEANDLNFQFKVQGTSSEPGATAPQFRFVVFEKDNQKGVGYIFPVTSKEENGTITVSMPVLKDIFQEKTTYIGKVEVIIGTRLLVPTTLELEFVKSLTIEVTPILPEGEAEAKVDDRKTPEELLPELEALEMKEVLPATVENTGGKKKITLTKSQLNQMILERKKQKTLKNPLKDLMKSALKDDDDTGDKGNT
jgi:hypothetical protein